MTGARTATMLCGALAAAALCWVPAPARAAGPTKASRPARSPSEIRPSVRHPFGNR